MDSRPRIAFMGTPDLCVPILEALSSSGHKPIVIVTNPDRPVGRKQILTPPKVKTWGDTNNIEVLQPEKPKGDFVLDFKKRNIDLSIVVAYGQILPQDLIDAPRLGTINIHYSLLPRWRGASPIESAILAGDKKTGVSIQQMVKKLDAGPILAEKEHLIDPKITAPELRNELNQKGAKLLLEILPKILSGRITPKIQNDSQATHCSKFTKSDGEVSLDDDPTELWRKFRAYYEWPRIFYFDKDGVRTIITDADFVDNKFIIKKILPAGGREIIYKDR